VSTLAISNVIAGYADLPIIREISLSVDAGEVVGVFGANGAGKTTLLRAASGLCRVFEGTVELDGESLVGRAPYSFARHGVAHVPEGRRMLKGLTVMENLLVGTRPRRPGQKEQLDAVLDMFPRLAERRRQQAHTLSGGEQQMVAIGRALMMQPKLLLLDEPSQGLSPAMVSRVFASLHQTTLLSNCAVIVVEQNARIVGSFIHRSLVMQGGRLRAEEAADASAGSRQLTLADFLGVKSTADGASRQPSPGTSSQQVAARSAGQHVSPDGQTTQGESR